MALSMKLWKQLIISLIIIGVSSSAWWYSEAMLGALGFAAESRESNANNRNRGNQSVPVIVAKVAIAENSFDFNAVGTSRAQKSIMLKSEDSGKIIELMLIPGKPFKAGDILMRLDDSEQTLAVELARTRKEQANRVFERFEVLRKSGNAAVAQLEEVRLAADVARIELDQALEELENRVLRAPFDGISGLTSVEQGERINIDTDIASYDDRSVLLVEFDLPEALLTRVEKNMPISATTPSSPQQAYAGKVVAVDSRVTASSRTVRVRVAIENETDELRPGASFTIKLSFKGKTYPIVPELALQFSQGALHVWHVKDEKADRVEVVMIRRRDGSVLIDGALKEGDLVVIEGTQRLSAGTKVNVLEQEDQAPTNVPAS